MVFLKSLKDLIKFGLTTSVVISAIAGYLLGVEDFDYLNFILLVIGGYALTGASNAFNQIIEKNSDQLMSRTKDRPLPNNYFSPEIAFFIASILTVIGLVSFYLINPMCAGLGAISIFIYCSLYTPLKKITPLAVFVGAIPGALPVIIGWIAATGNFGIEPGILFMIQFFWQFPHFWALAWVYSDDYKKADFHLLPTGKKDKATAKQIIIYSIWMVLISLVPALKMSGTLSLSIFSASLIFISGLIIVKNAFNLYHSLNDAQAKRLMILSILFLPFLQLIFLIDKFIIQ